MIPRLAAPEWLLLLPLLVFAAWRWGRVFRPPLRLAILLLVVLLLAQPQGMQRERGIDLWVLVDRSASAAGQIAASLGEWESILERSRGPDDRLHFIDYAADAALRDPTAGLGLAGLESDRNATKTGLALRYALSLVAPERTSRLLAITDGYATEPLADLEEPLLRQQIPLDLRFTSKKEERDFRIESLRLPPRVAPGEAFLMELRVSGPGPATIPYEVMRGDERLFSGTLTLPETGLQGRAVVRLTDRLATGGAHRYTARILPDTTLDAHPGNNHAEQWVEIAAGPRVILVTPWQKGDPLLPVLQANGFEVEVVTALQTLHPGRLQGAKAVILNNIPAYKLPSPFLEALPFFVREQGGGLLMAGGKQSFASGGYFGSPIADLLPVSMEKRQEQKKGVVAMAIVLDRSGSMAVSMGTATKMEMADAGAARAIELLGPRDQVAVYAVDTEPHEIVPLSVVGTSTGRLTNAVRRITSAGGGIYVGKGLEAAYEAVRKSPVGTRHIILFADANDSEEPGDYKAFIARMRQEEITLSVIGLGTRADSDAALLEELATLGGGRLFFTADAAELPAIFEQETVMVARAAFIEEPTPVAAQAGWGEIAARAIEWPAAVDGYNDSYLRPEATAVAVTPEGDAAGEGQSPLVAFWHRGCGRVAAVTFPLGGPFSGSVRAWPGYGDFAQTLVRWLHGQPTPPGLAVRTSMEGATLSADLLFDDSWEQDLAQTPPRLVLEGAGKENVQLVPWERMEPGRYRALLALAPGSTARGAVQIGKTVLPFGPYRAGADAEWEMDPARRDELLALSRASGGVERLDLASAWEAPAGQRRYRDLRHWLLPLLLALFLAEAALSRMGKLSRTGPAAERFRFPRLKFSRRVTKKRAEKAGSNTAAQAEAPPSQTPVGPAAPAAPAAVVPGETAEATPQIDRQSRFQRAKKGR